MIGRLRRSIATSLWSAAAWCDGGRSLPRRSASVALAGIASMIAGSAYPAVDPANTMRDGLRAPYGSANALLAPSLPSLVATCRHIERSTPVGRGATHGFCADLVGTGIGIEPTSGDEAIDELLRTGFEEWAKAAGVEGESLWELQHQAAAEIAPAGAVLWRLVTLPERIDEGHVCPLAIIPLEVEWFSPQPLRTLEDPSHRFVHGKELDRLGRTVAYHIRDPDTPMGPGEVVPAADIIHAYEKRRARQAHGEPDLAPVAIRMLQDDDLVSIELASAKNASAHSVLIQDDIEAAREAESYGTDDGTAEMVTTAAGAPVTRVTPGAIARLGESGKLTVLENKRPSQDVAKFRGTIRGDVAACTRTSQMHLDRDTARANYSSMRADQQITKKMLHPLQLALGRLLAGEIYQRVAPWIMLAAGRSIPRDPRARRRMLSYEVRPDQPEYVDPLKDAQAMAYAVAANLMTLEEALQARGRSIDEVLQKRATENARLAELGLPIPQLPEKVVLEMEQQT